jgi:glycosyltransferase involved in cell wall biosynthesis
MLTGSQNDTGANTINVFEIAGNALVGGMEHYILNLIRQLPPGQFQVTCLCPFESAFTAALREHGCAIFIAPIHDDPPWRSIQLAVEVIRHHQIDLVHAHMPKAHVLAGLAGCLTGTPVVATVHGMNITTHELGICRTTGSHLITVCQEAYTQALAMGVPCERLALIPNGVDVQAFTPQQDGARFRAAIGAPADAPLVGFVGRLAPEKGPDLFVRAARSVAAQRPDVHFTIVGEGDMEEALRRLIQDLDLDDRMHLAGLWENTAEVYPALDIVAHTSRSEGMPLALLEAMACGRPVVAIGVGGVPEVVEVGTTGLLAGAGDWNGVGVHVLRLLARPDRLQEMGRAARERVEKHFDVRTSARLTADLFVQLVGAGSRYRDIWHAWPAAVKS